MKQLLLCIMLWGWLPSLRAGGDVNQDHRTSISDLPWLVQWLLNPDAANGHDYVDLGLPSGTLWATANIGASSTSEAGLFVAWGETKEKSSYSWSTYQWVNAEDTTLTRYSSLRDTLYLSDDVACRMWGGLWQLPSVSQWIELTKYCRWSWALVNGTYGYRISSTSTSIFLPAVGYVRDETYYDANLSGSYWARETYASDSLSAYSFYIDEEYRMWAYRSKYTGRTVRATFNPDDQLLRYDVNGDSIVNISDVVALAQIL